MSNHWYNKDGQPAYTIVGKNGKERDTTLADAKRHGLVPSVTTIIGLLDKPWLNRWAIDQILNAVIADKSRIIKGNGAPKYVFEGCIDCPDIYKWKECIKEKADRIRQETSDRGSEIHDKLENYIRTGEMDLKDKKFLEPVIELLNKEFGEEVSWYPEIPFYCPSGFGGKVDLMGQLSNNKHVIIDFKTKNKEKVDEKCVTKEHGMQLAAYKKGLDLKNVMCYNLYISTVKEGNLYFHKWEKKEISNSYGMFDSLLRFWKLYNNIVESK